jgi:two-component system chemotaxis response regulator CheB
MIGELARTLRAHPPAVIAIGASAGAVEALMQLLPELPADLPAPVLVVVHVPSDRRSALPELFQKTCALPTREAEDKIMPDPATVYFAPPDYHLLVEHDGALALSVDEPVHHSRPSIDVLFDSVAEAYGARALGILLSGASRDGADGLAHIRTAGGHTWVQAPETAQVAVMPRAALAIAPHPTLDPRSMGRAIAEWGDHRG